MAGGSGGQNDVVWPGYVAAMASLLLSLLLVCAVLVMTIGQIGSLSESYQQAVERIGMGSAEEIKRLAAIAGIGDGTGDSNAHHASSNDDPSANAMPESSERFAARFHSAKFGRKTPSNTDKNGNSDEFLALDLTNGNFDRDAAKQAAAMAAQDKQLLAEVDLSKIDIRKIRFKNLDFSGIKLHRALTPQQIAKVDFSQVDFGRLTRERIEKLKPLLAKEAIRYQLELLKAQGPDRPVPPRKPEPVPPPPPPPVVAAPPPPEPPAASVLVPDHFRLIFSEETNELNRAQKQQLAVWADALKSGPEPIKVWAEIQPGDEFLQRSVYARLQLLRNWLVEAGLPGAKMQIAIQTLPAGAAPVRELTFHIARQKP